MGAASRITAITEITNITGCLLGGSQLPYKDDLSRNVLFSDSVDSIDQIGDQTRAVRGDWGLKGTGAETITFNAAVLGIKWIAPDGTTTTVAISGAWTLPTSEVAAIELYSDASSTVHIGYLALQEESDTTLYDSGLTSANGNYNATLSDASIWVGVLYAENWQNESNKYGYNTASGVIIPADMADLTKDVQGNALVNVGSVKYDAKVVGGVVGVGNGSSTAVKDIIYPTIDLEVTVRGKFNNIAGTQRMGSYGTDSRHYWGVDSGNWYYIFGGSLKTSVPADTDTHTFVTNREGMFIDGVKIYTVDDSTFTGTNTIYYSLFARNNGASDFCDFNMEYACFKVAGVVQKEFYFNNHAIDSISGNAANTVDLTFANSTATVKATIDSLANTVYRDGSGNLIINPQYAATTEEQLKGKGYKFVATIDYGNGAGVTGHFPMLIFDMQCQDGNIYGKPEYYTTAINPYINTTDSRIWSADAIAFILDNPDTINEAWRGRVYDFFKNLCKQTLTNTVVYGTQKLVSEQTKINNKKGCPTYSGLPVQVLNDNDETVQNDNDEVIINDL